MPWQFIITGLVLGNISSLHCVGMCGPLSLALPTQYLPKAQRIIAMLLYQLGRVITYSILGLVFGLAGRRVYLAGFQQWFSIGMGIFIFFLVIQYWIFRKNLAPHFLNRFYLAVQAIMIRILKEKRDHPILIVWDGKRFSSLWNGLYGISRCPGYNGNSRERFVYGIFWVWNVACNDSC